jgi:uncharacterized protein (TIRG00374 family)
MTDPTPARRPPWAMLISLAVSLGIVVYLLAKLDWPMVWTYLQQVKVWTLPLLIAALFPMIWMRAMRWRLILPNPEALSIPRLMDATIIGFFASFVLPLRAGEIIRPWVVSRWQPIKFTSALASIMIERLADSVCLLTLMLITLSRIPEVPPVILTGAQALASLTGVLILMVILCYLLPGRMERLFHWFCSGIIGRFAPHAAERINAMINDYFAGLRVIAGFGQLLNVLAWSAAMWLLLAVWYWALVWAFGIEASLWVGMMLNVMIALAVAAPSAPGFIGTFQIGCILALSTVYGYSKEFAMAYSVIGHLLQTLFNITAGLLVLNARGMKFHQLRDPHPVQPDAQ